MAYGSLFKWPSILVRLTLMAVHSPPLLLHLSPTDPPTFTWLPGYQLSWQDQSSLFWCQSTPCYLSLSLKSHGNLSNSHRSSYAQSRFLESCKEAAFQLIIFLHGFAGKHSSDCLPAKRRLCIDALFINTHITFHYLRMRQQWLQRLFNMNVIIL